MIDIARLKQEKRGVIWIDVRAIEHKVLCRTDEGNGRLDVVEAARLVAEVLTLEWPADPRQARSLLDHLWEFDTVVGTQEDRRRTQMYREEFQRQELRDSLLTFRDFIESLNLEIDISPLAAEDVPRASQLTLRTNQFNFTTVRRSEEEIRRFLEQYRGRLLTTWPVLAEACHFLPERVQVRFLRWIAAGGLSVIELHESALATIADWKEKYRNIPMDLADASLLWVAEQTGTREILTLDLRGFAAYRLPDGQALAPVLP